MQLSVAVHVDPDVLIGDEILAVGDSAFQARCYDKIRRMRNAGKTILCASHSAGLLGNLCNKAIRIDHGSLIMSGTLADVVDAYQGSSATAAAH